MSSEQRNKRLTAVAVSNAVNGTEGVPVTDTSMLLAKKWANDIITGEEMVNELIKIHKKVAS